MNGMRKGRGQICTRILSEHQTCRSGSRYCYVNRDFSLAQKLFSRFRKENTWVHMTWVGYGLCMVFFLSEMRRG